MLPPLHHSYNGGLVALSVAIAILAAFTSLDVSGRIFAATGRVRGLWIAGGGVAMGVGIWSMHLVGMMALTLPMKISYGWPHLVISLLVACGASAFALWIAARRSVRRGELIAAAGAMGLAIAGMHYVGMAGMELSARVAYDRVLWWTSILIAVTASYVALRIARRLRRHESARTHLKRGGAAVIMGFAIAGMHYTGMAAASFTPMVGAPELSEPALASKIVPLLIAVGSVLVVAIAIVAAMMDRLIRSKVVEAQLRAEKEAAVATNRAKSEFLSNMSHELRTPLNSIIGFSHILLKNKGQNLRPTDLTQVSRIASNGKHLLGVINGVLDLSKIEAGRVELEMGWVDLQALVRETLDEMAPQAEALEVTLITDVPADTPKLYADVARLKQIIINLVSNAIKFTKGGSVTLRVSRDPHTQRPVRIDVVDTGIGIPKDRLETVFEAFKQADASTTRQYGGTGLGLTITRSLAELMGWTIEVDSTVGVGTTFSVLLGANAESTGDPLLPQTRESRIPVVTARHAIASFTAPSFLVLIIDDEADARALLQHELEELHCDVISAASADEGIALARKVKPDLITLDMMMPRKSGLEALRELKADEDLRDIPVVIVSVVAEDKRGSGIGAVDFINKPITREKLAHLIPRTGGDAAQPRILLVKEADMDLAKYEEIALATDMRLDVVTETDEADRMIARPEGPPDLVLLDGSRWSPRLTTWVSSLQEQHHDVRVAIVLSKATTDDELPTEVGATVLQGGDALAGELDAMLVGVRERKRVRPLPAA